MMKWRIGLCGLLGIFILNIHCACWAASDAAILIGNWQTIDDVTHKPRSIVQIFEAGGEIKGRITKVFYAPDETGLALCEKCKGERHNQPFIGMVILWGMTLHGDHWAGGKIIDPHNGKEYNCTLQLIKAGQQLRVRGYIGIPIFGRSQIWNHL
jgi:uncharacterized protein (DUF2147 family)